MSLENLAYKKVIGGSLTTAAYTPETSSVKLLLYGRAIHHIETTNVRRRREVTAGWCVAQHRRCVADLATSQPYLYEVLGGKADTLDAEHLRLTLHKTSHPSRHRIVIVLQNIKTTGRRLATAPCVPETSSVKLLTQT